MQNFIKVVEYLLTKNYCNDKRRCVGFYLGGIVNSIAVNVPSLKVAVAFYGRQPAADDTAPTRYSESAAKLAWQRTIDFFGKYLK